MMLAIEKFEDPSLRPARGKKQIKINNSVKNQKGKETKDIWLPSSPFMLEMKKKKKKKL